MPRLVVPIFTASTFADSRWASSSRCSARISVTFSAIFRLLGETSMPWPASLAISSTKCCGSSTTPLPMIESFPGRTMPDGQQRELIDIVVDDERMAGVMAALKAHHDVGLDRQPIDDLALAFVAPLGADHHHIRHRTYRLAPRSFPSRAAKNKPGANWLHRAHCGNGVLSQAFKVKGLSAARRVVLDRPTFCSKRTFSRRNFKGRQAFRSR